MENNENNTQQPTEGLEGIAKNNLRPETFAKLQEELKKIAPVAATEPPKPADPPITETKPEVGITPPLVVQPTGTPEEDPFKDSIFFAGIKPGTTETETVEVTDLKGLAGYLKTEGLFDLKDETEIPKFIDEVKMMKEKMNGWDEKEQKLSSYDNLFVSMPDIIYKAIDKWAKNEDYESELRTYFGSKLDFAKDFDKHKIEDLVEHYYPGEFSTEDYQEDDNKALNIAKKNAKEKFENEKKGYKPYREISN